MDRRPSALASSSQPLADGDLSADEHVTFSEFLAARVPDWSQPADGERRQRRRTEHGAPSPARYPPTDDHRTLPRASPLYPPRTTSTMQGAPRDPLRRPPTSPPPAMSNGTIRERGSLEPVPRWQPDHEVSACPVCKTAFSFFFRKHHCRKCGRVVCNNCSPHRITIPRQYVVQPPSVEGNEVSEAYPARNLGGGEVVRVCNPCVPDPWTPEGARDAANSARSRQVSIESGNGGDTARVRQRYRSHVGTSNPSLPQAGRMRAQSHQPIPNFSRSLPGGPPTPSHSFGGRHIPDHPSAASSSSSRPRHRHTQSSANAPPPYQSFDPRVRPLSAAPNAGPAAHPPPAYRQRRQVAEEDECPVCGEELPPGDTIRTAHIEDCISTRFGTPSNTAIPTSPPPTNTPPTRPRAPTFRPRGMALYRATEKDCADAAGEAQECVICFEEFAPGDEMGRMECLCKFHRACIRRWWETKGAGSCPTHQLHSD